MNRPERLSRLAPLLLVLLAVSGCSLFAHPRPETEPVVQRPAPPFDTISTYMAYLRQLSISKPEAQKQLFDQVSHDYDTAPSANAQLRMGLALVLLGDPLGNLTRGRDLLQDLVAPKGQLPPSLEALALTMIDVATRQQSETQQTSALAAKLQDAQHKIKALTNIEQTIEQPAGPDK